MEQIIYAAIYLVIMVIAFLLGKYVTPRLFNSQLIKTIADWTYKFVVSAKNQYGDDKGEEKLTYVTELVKNLCDKAHVTLTDEQIRALIEDAYKQMKDSEQ